MTASSELLQLFEQLGHSASTQWPTVTSAPSSPAAVPSSSVPSVDAEFEIAVAVAKVVDPHLQPTSVHKQFELMVHPLVQIVQSQKVSVGELLNFFQQLGFGQSTLTRVLPEHSNIAWVMDNREGLPIVLAALLVSCARRCRLDAHGINFPGHFLVSLDGRLVDPLGLQEVAPDSLQLSELDEAAVERMLQGTSAVAFGLRMLNNVKAQYLNAQDWLGALDLIDYQGALGGQDKVVAASLEFERGELWEQLGAYAVACEAFQRCADMSELPELSEQATQRAKRLVGRSETLH